MNTTIFATVELQGCCRKDEAWTYILDFPNYAKLIPQIDTIHIHQASANQIQSEWFITLDGAPFSWIELDTIQQSNFSLQSEAISGDFDIFKGCWKIEDLKTGGINLAYKLEYKLGIPVIEENCGFILREKLQHYVDTLIEKQSSLIKKNAYEGRRFKRIIINRNCRLLINGCAVEAKVLNFSRGGMQVRLTSGTPEKDQIRKVEFHIDSLPLTGYFCENSLSNTQRVVFAEPLFEPDFKSLFTKWVDGIAFSDEMVKICEVVTIPSLALARQHRAVSS